MAQAKLRLVLLGLAAGTLLTGCVDGGSGTGEKTSAAPSFLGGGKSGSREVEAPDVFQVTDTALWDGRPSLGGIWVASPDVGAPERVVMVNVATGKTVNGALFKRERDNPGPALQISSDAAEALGILAGQPTEIRVTALRKEEVEAPATAEAPVAGAAAPASDAAAAETAAMATAALDAADGVAPVAADGAVAAAADATLPDAAPAEPPKKKTWKERRAEAKAKREAEKAAKAAAAAAAEAGVTAAPLDTVDPAAGAVASVETAPLDGGAPAAPAKEPVRKVVGDAAAPPPAPAADAAPPVASGASRPIQIASFSKEENANRAVAALAKIGVTAQPQKSEKAGKAVWGVVAQGDGALLKKIKDAGFADAYFLQ